MTDRVRHVIGCMTGTSLDGLDAALVRITGEGLAMKAEFVRMVSHPLGGLADTLRSFANGNAHPPIDFLRASRKLGELHAQACAELATDAKVDFVVAHGQTIWHAPRDEAGRLSWQLFDPWPIVRRLRVPVCYDLRQADLLAGGEGAPITPIADWAMYRSEQRSRAVVNLGGICNITELPLFGGLEHIRGSDIGPCNLLLDGLTRRLYPGRQFDADGAIAASGSTHPPLLSSMVMEIASRSVGARSQGREIYNESFLDALLARAIGIRPEDVMATAVHALAIAICGSASGPDPKTELVIAGGGCRNISLVAQMGAILTAQRTLTLTSDLGIPVEAREAMAFAVLGALSQDGVPITLPRVTGSEAPGRAGAWAYP